MNKAGFVAEVARKASITRAEAARALDAAFNVETGAISEALDRSGTFSVAGFGQFTPSKKFAGKTFQKRRRSGKSGITAGLDTDQAPIAGSVAELHDEVTEEVRGLALQVWEDSADAEEFLTTPHGLLDGQTPLAASRTEEGAKRVREILLALEYGLPV